METTVNVTQRDIERGMCASCVECPIALAASRAFGHRVSVTEWDLGFENKTYTLPEDARHFIQRFDSGLHVEPFSFTVEEGNN